MKIVEIYGENIKRLKAVRYKPNEGVTILSGANGEGKTSSIDIMWFALKNADASKENPEVIRRGEKEATAFLDLGEYTVTRKFTENGSTLEVKNKDGAKFPSPQAMLDKLISSISLDPLAFLNYDSDKQRKLMLSFTDLTAALSKKDLEIKGVYEDRTFINKQLEQEMGNLHSLEQIDLPDDIVENRERIDVEDIRKKVKYAIENNKDFDAKVARLKSVRDKISELETELFRWNNTLKSLLAEKEIRPIDTQGLIDSLSSAEQRNKHIDTLDQYEKQNALCESLHNKSTSLTEQLEALRGERMDAIKSAKYPLEGLGINDDGITFNDIPFIQLSSAEKLRVSVSMAIALNPKLKVIRITDGSLLDSKSMAIIESLAAENDFQVLVEKVDETGEIGIVIEDGEISKNNYENPPKKTRKK